MSKYSPMFYLSVSYNKKSQGTRPARNWKELIDFWFTMYEGVGDTEKQNTYLFNKSFLLAIYDIWVSS